MRLPALYIIVRNITSCNVTKYQFLSAVVHLHNQAKIPGKLALIDYVSRKQQLSISLFFIDDSKQLIQLLQTAMNIADDECGHESGYGYEYSPQE